MAKSFDTVTGSLAKQVGGDHYKRGLQPFQLSMANGHDACTHAIQKYLTRHSLKDGLEGLKKAHHIVNIRYDTMMIYGVHNPPAKDLISIEDYIRSNSLDDVTSVAIRLVEAWHKLPGVDHKFAADKIRKAIRTIGQTLYPETYDEKDFL